jgi:alanine-glyoxylate transaminase/serine-glyoxylate transaminase/serine-pyruvate transaminase
MAIRSFDPPPRMLMGPGPSAVPSRVLQAMARPCIGHLDPAFVTMMDEVGELLRGAFRTANRLTMAVSAPGSAGMETCLVNLIEPGDVAIIARNGVFGGRMAEIVRRAGGTAVVVDDPWGRAVDPDKVRAALREHPEAKLVAFVHAETSTGAQSDAATLCALAREHGALAVVDAVTSLGGVPVLVDEWGVDAIYSGSQKCLSCTPGLSPISLSERAVAAIAARKQPVQSWFLDLQLVMGYWGGGAKRSYHHTAPIHALYGLHEALVMLHEEGLEAAWARHRLHHAALRAGLEAMGLALLVPEAERLPQLNAVRVPEGVDEAAVRQLLLRDHGLEIGAGLGELAGKVWRIGLMGHSCDTRHVLGCLAALEGAIATQRAPAATAGAGVAAARASYAAHAAAS